MRSRKRMNYKVLSESREKIEVVENQEQQRAEKIPEISTLLRNISISEELEHLHQEDNMEIQIINSLKVDEFTLVKDITDYIDVGDSSTVEEVDSKISRVE